MTPRYLDSNDQEKIGDFCLQLSNKLAPTLPTKLWHYTSAQGLIGILDSKFLWASHIAGMNDAYEFRYSVGSLIQAIDFRLAMDVTLSEDIRAMHSTLRDNLNLKLEDVPSIFVSCFTEDVDLSNHWGEYGDRGRGYAMGISTQDLLLACRDHGLFLLKCNYSDKETKDLMAGIVLFAENIFPTLRQKNPSINVSDLRMDFLRYYTWNLAFLAPSFKNPSFVHEREWRVTYRVADFDYSQMEFAAKGAEIRPRIKFDLLRKFPPTTHLPLSDIYIGPVRLDLDKELAEISVRALLKKHGYSDDVKIHRSESTYRG